MVKAMKSVNKKTAKVLRQKRRLAAQQLPPKPEGYRVRLGSGCSGMATKCMAFDALNVPYEHVFACERDKHMQHFKLANHKPQQLINDIMTTEHLNAPAVDCYVGGFPCQPFSTMGKHGGEADPRGCIVQHMIAYIKKALPRCFILENVRGLLTRHPDVMIKVLRALQAITEADGSANAYRVTWKVLNAQDFAAPQDLTCIAEFLRWL